MDHRTGLLDDVSDQRHELIHFAASDQQNRAGISRCHNRESALCVAARARAEQHHAVNPVAIDRVQSSAKSGQDRIGNLRGPLLNPPSARLIKRDPVRRQKRRSQQSLVGGPATIDQQTLSGHVGRRIRGEEHGRPTMSPAVAKRPIGVWYSSRLPCTSCSSRPCVRSVSTQPGASVFTRTPALPNPVPERLRQHFHPALRCAIGRRAHQPDMTRHRADVDDGPAPCPPSRRPDACSTGTCR